MKPVVPLVEELADVLEREVEIGEFVAEVDGSRQVAVLGAAARELEEQFLPAGLLAERQRGERFLEVPLSESPVVPFPEADAEIHRGLPLHLLVTASNLKFGNRFVDEIGLEQACAEFDAVLDLYDRRFRDHAFFETAGGFVYHEQDHAPAEIFAAEIRAARVVVVAVDVRVHVGLLALATVEVETFAALFSEQLVRDHFAEHTRRLHPVAELAREIRGDLRQP